MIRSLCLLALALATAHVVAGTNDCLVADYMPSLNGRPWPRVPVTAFVETRSNTWVHPSFPKKFPTFQEIHDGDADFATIVMRLPSGSVFKTYNAFVLGPYLAAVYSGDFNSDGILDFMAVKPGSGCGLAGEYCFGVFAFSNGNSYNFRRILTMGLGPQNLVIDPKTKSFRLIHTSFREGKTLDGRYHNFWVHRFFKWEYGNLEEDSNLSPVWIQYLYQPNHEPTKLLTPKLKAKAWADDFESQRRIEW